MIGDPKANSLLAIKRLPLLWKKTVKLDFQVPVRMGKNDLMLYYMSDSYLGCDQVR